MRGNGRLQRRLCGRTPFPSVPCEARLASPSPLWTSPLPHIFVRGCSWLHHRRGGRAPFLCVVMGGEVGFTVTFVDELFTAHCCARQWSASPSPLWTNIFLCVAVRGEFGFSITIVDKLFAAPCGARPWSPSLSPLWTCCLPLSRSGLAHVKDLAPTPAPTAPTTTAMLVALVTGMPCPCQGVSLLHSLSGEENATLVACCTWVPIDETKCWRTSVSNLRNLGAPSNLWFVW